MSLVFSYLDKTQWKYIHSILAYKTKTTFCQEKIQKINNIIYVNYFPWATAYARQFKQFHYHKCKEIPQQELNLYALTGLNKAIQKYQPTKYENATFSSYAKKYIIGELYLGMTELQPLTIVPKSERKKGALTRKRPIDSSLFFLMGDDEYLVDECNNRNNHMQPTRIQCENMWLQIDSANCSILVKQMIHLKFSFDFNKINSNQKIAKLLGYSEEYVRQELRAFFDTFFIDF